MPRSISRAEDGLALMAMMWLLVVLSTLGAALVFSSTTDARIAGAFQAGLEARQAADAAAERALVDLAAAADWNPVLDGSAPSSFVDGPAHGVRETGGAGPVDLDELGHMMNCGRTIACSDAQLDAVTADRPWGANNPRWRLYAYGPLAGVSRVSLSRFYAVVFVADDPAETDGNPARDAETAQHPGHGVVLLRAAAFGPAGARRVIELTVVRETVGGPEPARLRVASWLRVS
jgi:hypothetical protein